MRISAINNVYQRKVNQQSQMHKLQQGESLVNPNFKGDFGRGVGSIVGFIGGTILVTAASAVLAIPTIAGIAAVAVATKACGDEGHKIEEKKKKNQPGGL